MTPLRASTLSLSRHNPSKPFSVPTLCSLSLDKEERPVDLAGDTIFVEVHPSNLGEDDVLSGVRSFDLDENAVLFGVRLSDLWGDTLLLRRLGLSVGESLPLEPLGEERVCVLKDGVEGLGTNESESANGVGTSLGAYVGDA